MSIGANGTVVDGSLLASMSGGLELENTVGVPADNPLVRNTSMDDEYDDDDIAELTTGDAISTAQVIVDYTYGELANPMQYNYDKFRRMRLDPTIALAREYSIAPILSSGWMIEGDDTPDSEEKVDFLKKQLLPQRTHLLRTFLLSEIDFGWKGYELTYKVDPESLYTGIDKIKPLKVDNTFARYEIPSGNFLGLSTSDFYTGQKYFIDALHSLFLNFDDEGLGQYATSKLRIAEKPFDQWEEANNVACLYDKKVAGSFLVIWYPVGSTEFVSKTGTEAIKTDNARIAQSILRALKATGSVAIPVEINKLVANLNSAASNSAVSAAWKIEFLESSGQQANFLDRLAYLDKLKCRAFNVTERSILEGVYGTKAEATTHASAVLLYCMLKHETVTEYINCELGGRLLMANFHSKEGARLVAMPLADDRLALFEQIFVALLADPGIGPEIKDLVNVESLMHALKIPISEDGGTAAQDAAEDAMNSEDMQPADGTAFDEQNAA